MKKITVWATTKINHVSMLARCFGLFMFTGSLFNAFGQLQTPVNRKVLILNFVNQNQNKPSAYLTTSIPNAFVGPLKKTGQFTVLSRDLAESTRLKANIAAADTFKDKFATTLGKKARAEVVVCGNFVALDKHILLQAKAIDVLSGRVRASHSVRARLGSAVFDQIDIMVKEMTRQMVAELKPIQPSVVEKAVYVGEFLTLAIYPFSASENEKSQALAATEKLEQVLTKSKKFKVIPSQQLLANKSKVPRSLPGNDEALAMAKFVGADKLVRGNLANSTLQVTIIDTKTGRAEASRRSRYNTKAGIDDTVEFIAHELSKNPQSFSSTWGLRAQLLPALNVPLGASGSGLALAPSIDLLLNYETFLRPRWQIDTVLATSLLFQQESSASQSEASLTIASFKGGVSYLYILPWPGFTASTYLLGGYSYTILKQTDFENQNLTSSNFMLQTLAELRYTINPQLSASFLTGYWHIFYTGADLGQLLLGFSVGYYL